MAHLHLDIPAALVGQKRISIFCVLSSKETVVFSIFYFSLESKIYTLRETATAEVCHSIPQAVMLCSHTAAAAALVRRQLESGKLCTLRG